MSDETSVTIVCVALVAVCMLLGGTVGHGISQKEMRKEAVKAGVAVWIVDEDGKTEFKWKTGVEK